MMMSRWVVRLLLQLNSHEHANDMLWWTVQFSDYDGTRLEGGSCMRYWKRVPRGRSCHVRWEDRPRGRGSLLHFSFICAKSYFLVLVIIFYTGVVSCVFVLKWWTVMSLFHAHGAVADFAYLLLHTGPIREWSFHISLESRLNSYKEETTWFLMQHTYPSLMLQQRWAYFKNYLDY